MAARETAPVTIELRIGSEPIEGALRVGESDPQPFRGWLQLTPLLEAAANDHTADGR
jgi:hypothetical protein